MTDDTDDQERQRWFQETRDRWEARRHEYQHKYWRSNRGPQPPPDIDMRVYQIVAEGARPKILPEIIAHRQALQPQSVRELRDWLKHRAGGARYRAQQLSRQARQYEVMLARLDEMNVVTAPALKLIK